MKRVLALLLCLVISLPASSCGGGSKGDTSYFIGLEYQQQRLCDKAIEEFDKAIEADPKFAEPHHRKGMCYAELGEYHQALIEFSKAIDLNPFFTQAYGNRGTVQSILGEYELALKDHDKLVALDPTSLSYFFRGTDNLRLGNLQQAADDLTTALNLLQTIQCAHINRGVAFHRLKQYEKAADFGYELDRYPEYPLAYFNRAESERLSKKYDEAVSDFTKVIESDSSDVNFWRGSAYTGRGLALQMLKRQKEADADFSKGIEIGEDPDEQKAFIDGEQETLNLYICDLLDFSG